MFTKLLPGLEWYLMSLTEVRPGPAEWTPTILCRKEWVSHYSLCKLGVLFAAPYIEQVITKPHEFHWLTHVRNFKWVSFKGTWRAYSWYTPSLMTGIVEPISSSIATGWPSRWPFTNMVRVFMFLLTFLWVSTLHDIYPKGHLFAEWLASSYKLAVCVQLCHSDSSVP